MSYNLLNYEGKKRKFRTFPAFFRHSPDASISVSKFTNSEKLREKRNFRASKQAWNRAKATRKAPKVSTNFLIWYKKAVGRRQPSGRQFRRKGPGFCVTIVTIVTVPVFQGFPTPRGSSLHRHRNRHHRCCDDPCDGPRPDHRHPKRPCFLDMVTIVTIVTMFCPLRS